MERFKMTLVQAVSLTGRGVHSNAPVTLTLRPDPDFFGIGFVRRDLGSTIVPLALENTSGAPGCTVVQIDEHHQVSTIEHLLAALSAFDMGHVVIEVDGPEMPIVDGCSATFMQLILQGGLKALPVPDAPALVPAREVRVGDAEHWIAIAPPEAPELSIALTHDFKGREGLGSYQATYTHSIPEFQEHIAPARTFGFYQDAQKLHAQGLALGASLDNTVVFQEGAVMNPGGLRFENEMARHKVLDVLGDLYVCGRPVYGRITAYNTSHALNHALLQRIVAQEQEKQRAS